MTIRRAAFSARYFAIGHVISFAVRATQFHFIFARPKDRFDIVTMPPLRRREPFGHALIARRPRLIFLATRAHHYSLSLSQPRREHRISIGCSNRCMPRATTIFAPFIYSIRLTASAAHDARQHFVTYMPMRGRAASFTASARKSSRRLHGLSPTPSDATHFSREDDKIFIMFMPMKLVDDRLHARTRTQFPLSRYQAPLDRRHLYGVAYIGTLFHAHIDVHGNTLRSSMIACRRD